MCCLFLCVGMFRYWGDISSLSREYPTQLPFCGSRLAPFPPSSTYIKAFDFNFGHGSQTCSFFLAPICASPDHIRFLLGPLASILFLLICLSSTQQPERAFWTLGRCQYSLPGSCLTSLAPWPGIQSPLGAGPRCPLRHPFPLSRMPASTLTFTGFPLRSGSNVTNFQRFP